MRFSPSASGRPCSGPSSSSAPFLIVSLLELWSVLPPLLHRVLLGAFGLALLVSFLPLIRLPLPTRPEALRRLERNANIKHRPASSYEDRLGATPPKETALLWAAHRERLARLVAKLKPSWPAPRTDRKDPYALRAALLSPLSPPCLPPAAIAGTACARRSRRRRVRHAGASQARCLGDAPRLYRHRPDRACRRQRAGGSGRRELPRFVGAGAERADRPHACAPRRDREPVHEQRRRLGAQDDRAQDGRQPRTGRVQRGADAAGQRRCQDRRPDRLQMAVRSDQGRGAHHQPDGQSDHHPARGLAPRLPRRRRSWRGQRRSQVRAEPR